MRYNFYSPDCLPCISRPSSQESRRAVHFPPRPARTKMSSGLFLLLAPLPGCAQERFCNVSSSIIKIKALHMDRRGERRANIYRALAVHATLSFFKCATSFHGPSSAVWWVVLSSESSGNRGSDGQSLPRIPLLATELRFVPRPDSELCLVSVILLSISQHLL